MRVLAVDPGYGRLGVAVLERDQQKEVLIYSSCIETGADTPLQERLFTLGRTFKNILETYQPTTVALETLFFNKNIKTALGVAEARGIIRYLAEEYACAFYEFSPQEIKIAVTGYGKSDKAAVFSMLKKIMPALPEGALDDEYDAIAIGITCLAHHGSGR